MLSSFLCQTHEPKNTPGVSNHRDYDAHEDGYGFAALTHKWGIWKSPEPYYREPHINSIIGHVVKSSDYIVGHIRNSDTDFAPPAMENTHPFLYRNYIFVHNGSLMNLKGERTYDMHLEKGIDSKYQRHIRGDTDSERIFYLLISLSKKYGNNWNQVFTELFQIIDKYHKEYTMNFIFARGREILFGRIASKSIKPLSLYFNLEKGHLVAISSEPVAKETQLVPEGHIYLYDAETNTLMPIPLG